MSALPPEADILPNHAAAISFACSSRSITQRKPNFRSAILINARMARKPSTPGNGRSTSTNVGRSFIRWPFAPAVLNSATACAPHNSRSHHFATGSPHVRTNDTAASWAVDVYVAKRATPRISSLHRRWPRRDYAKSTPRRSARESYRPPSGSPSSLLLILAACCGVGVQRRLGLQTATAQQNPVSSADF
jgi:hypothetical protein